jgi:hypothetical protein
MVWGNWPITGLPSDEQIGDLPGSLATEAALFGAMTLAAGFVWLLFLVSAVIETIAELQNRHLADVPLAGPIQTFVRQLVAATLLSVSATGAAAGPRVAPRATGQALRPPPGGLPALPAAPSHTAVGYQPGPPRPSTQDMRTAAPDSGPGPWTGTQPSPQPSRQGPQVAGLPSPSPSPPIGGHPDVPTPRSNGSSDSPGSPVAGASGNTGGSSNPDTARPGATDRLIVVGELDTPWSLAEEHLGDGMAWRDLFEANRHRPQPDGRTWTDPEVVEAGWKLVLPADPTTETIDPSQTLDPGHIAPGRHISPETFDPGRTLDPGHIAPGSHISPDRQTPPKTDGPLARVDAICRALTDDLAHSPHADIVGMRASADSIDVLLAAPAAPPPGFDAGSRDATLWRVLDDGPFLPPEQRSRRSIPLLPTLVTFGRSPEGQLLFDVERLGALAVQGDPLRVRAWLAAVAKELTAAPWANDISLRVAGLPDLDAASLARQDDVEVVRDIAQVADEAAGFAMATSTALEQQSTQAARSIVGGAWSPMVIVAGAGVPDELVSLCRFGGSGLAVVAAGDLPQARWRFEIDSAGQGVLHPWGVRCSTAS